MVVADDERLIMITGQTVDKVADSPVFVRQGCFPPVIRVISLEPTSGVLKQTKYVNLDLLPVELKSRIQAALTEALGLNSEEHLSTPREIEATT